MTGSNHILVTGGASSGKSRFAEELAAGLLEPVIYLATGTASDAEMAERIARHQKRRPKGWITIEEPLAVAAVFESTVAGHTILLDCLTFFVSNVYFAKSRTWQGVELEQAVAGELTALANAVGSCPAHVVIVTNEIGSGLVPETELGRKFRDWAGIANQMLADVCEEVYWVVSGIPVLIKGAGHGL